MEHGLWMPECRVMSGTSNKAYADAHGCHFPDGSPALVVRPSHLYRCPCWCHQSGQLALLEVVTA